MAELSILIPARNEMFLKNTVEDILENIEADTEIIVVLDGQWAEPGLEQHPKLKVVYLPVSIGQRAATNMACRLSLSKYVMKIDAHCSFDKGFDKKMLDKMQDNYTMVPIMRNLHAFDRVCSVCGRREYQGPALECCGKEMEKEIKWIGKESPQSTSYRFNTDLEFKYWGEYKAKQEGDIVDTMSLQGSCFLMTREKYWELNICDEEWGSWGGQGAEVALKTWLSGGEVKCNKTTWYAHMFRTQGGDFGFPYPNPGKEQKKAKDSLRDIFLNDKWPNAKHKLQWLLDKFNPPEWESNSEKGIIFYTDNAIPLKIARGVQKQLNSIGLPITSASLKPMAHFGNNEQIKEKRGRKAYFKQILSCLERCNSKIVYFCEHDVLYHPSHFDFTPKDDKFYFNTNVWKWNMEKEYGLWVDDCKQISGMVCFREKALDFYREKVIQIENDKFDRHFEPQNDRIGFESKFPNVDIRHANNLTKSRWEKNDFRNEKFTEGWAESKIIPGWNEIIF